MKCEHTYCIYNSLFLCIPEEVRINSLGMCDDCTIVSIEENALKDMKESQLMDFV